MFAGYKEAGLACWREKGITGLSEELMKRGAPEHRCGGGLGHGGGRHLLFFFTCQKRNKERWKEMKGKPRIPLSHEMWDKTTLWRKWTWEGWEIPANVRLGGLANREEWMPRAGLQASSPCAMPPIFPFPHLRGTSDQSSSWIFQSCVFSSDCGKCVTHWVTSTTCYHFLSFHFPKQVGTGKPWGGWGHAADMWTYPVLSWRKMKGILTSESGDFISMPLNEYVYAIKYF